VRKRLSAHGTGADPQLLMDWIMKTKTALPSRRPHSCLSCPSCPSCFPMSCLIHSAYLAMTEARMCASCKKGVSAEQDHLRYPCYVTCCRQVMCIGCLMHCLRATRQALCTPPEWCNQGAQLPEQEVVPPKRLILNVESRTVRLNYSATDQVTCRICSEGLCMTTTAKVMKKSYSSSDQKSLPPCVVFPQVVPLFYGRSFLWSVKSVGCCDQFTDNMYVAEWFMHLASTPRCESDRSRPPQPFQVPCLLCTFPVTSSQDDPESIGLAWKIHTKEQCVFFTQPCVPVGAMSSRLSSSGEPLGVLDLTFHVKNSLDYCQVSSLPVPLPLLPLETTYTNGWEMSVHGGPMAMRHPWAGACYNFLTDLQEMLHTVTTSLWGVELPSWATTEMRCAFLNQDERAERADYMFHEIYVFLYYTLRDVPSLKTNLVTPLHYTLAWIRNHAEMRKGWLMAQHELTTRQETVILALGLRGNWFDSKGEDDMTKWLTSPGDHTLFRHLAVPQEPQRMPLVSSDTVLVKETPLVKKTSVRVSATQGMAFSSPAPKRRRELLVESPNVSTVVLGTPGPDTTPKRQVALTEKASEETVEVEDTCPELSLSLSDFLEDDALPRRVAAETEQSRLVSQKRKRKL
jgi:hypothetical protein